VASNSSVNMLARTSRTFVRAMHASSALLADAAAPAAAAGASSSGLVLNLAVPSRSLVANKVVKRVTVPGRGGVLGLQKDTPPVVAELRPGIVSDYSLFS
jgi:hypothetical protein